MSSSVLGRRVAERLPVVAQGYSVHDQAKRWFRGSSGLIWCMLGALSYTLANLCLRGVAGVCDPLWGTWMRAAVPAIWLAPRLMGRRFSGERVLPAPRLLLALLASSVLVQWGGNLMFQLALEIIGMSVAVPTAFGFLLVVSAVLGRVFLGERIPARSATAIVLVIGALILLSAGACSTAKCGVLWTDRRLLVGVHPSFC